MEVQIHSVNKTKNQADNIFVKAKWQQKNNKIKRKSQKFTHFAREISRWSQVQDRALLGLHIYLWEYIQKTTYFPKKLLQLYLVIQGRTQLHNISHIIKFGVEPTC